MKKFLFTIVLLFTGLGFAFSQDTIKDTPVRSAFESGILIDNQTGFIPTAKTLELLIQHRFGAMDNGLEDLFGIYSSANIRIGFNYSLRDNLMIGYGLTRKNMYNDFQVKWTALKQTKKNTIPVFVTLYGNMAIDGRADEQFGDDYKFGNRFSYFSQLIIGRRFNSNFSLQAHTSFTHYNKMIATMDHDKIGVGFNGRIKFSPQSSFIFQYDIPLKIESISEQNEYPESKSNFGIGYEVSTSTHAFQVYITSANSILLQDNYMFNQNDWTDGTKSLMIGFTITRLWSF